MLKHALAEQKEMKQRMQTTYFFFQREFHSSGRRAEVKSHCSPPTSL